MEWSKQQTRRNLNRLDSNDVKQNMKEWNRIEKDRVEPSRMAKAKNNGLSQYETRPPIE